MYIIVDLAKRGVLTIVCEICAIQVTAIIVIYYYYYSIQLRLKATTPSIWLL